ncbi:MAG: hypothetical protein ACREQ2_17500 [Candidatus Binatia bacterium]
MKIAIVTVAMTGLTVLCSVANIAEEPKNKRVTSQGALSKPANLSPMTPAVIRTMLIERKKASWQPMHESVPLHEKKTQDQIAALQIKKELYEKDLISKLELENSERALANMRSDTEQIREWTAADERALSRVEESTGEKPKRSARSARRRSRARARLTRYDGATSWSIDEVEKIDTFFRKRFGRPLPISALGQSPTHDHLGLDHSDAVDVAVRPDSAEGRGLMAYLRGAGIPFTAFRGKISRMSTGAHIHIGPPSPRLVVVKRDSTHLEKPDEAAERS